MICKWVKNGAYWDPGSILFWFSSSNERCCKVFWKELTYFPLAGKSPKRIAVYHRTEASPWPIAFLVSFTQRTAAYGFPRRGVFIYELSWWWIMHCALWIITGGAQACSVFLRSKMNWGVLLIALPYSVETWRMSVCQPHSSYVKLSISNHIFSRVTMPANE